VTAAGLSPEGALRWLASLSIDLRATAVLDASGAVLAGDAALGARAAAALGAAAGGASEAVPAEVGDGDLLAMRAGRHTVAAALGPHALRRVTRCDLAAAAVALDGT
jgi:hypothetical protein